MPLTLQVGLSKKIGQPNYGSLGASCNLAIELDQALLASDPESLQLRVRQAFAACRHAVHEELTQRAEFPRQAVQQAIGAEEFGAGQEAAGEGDAHVEEAVPASRKQLDYAGTLARRIHGLGLRRLEKLTDRMFSKPVAALDHCEASQLIDVLKQIKEGQADLEDMLGHSAEDGTQSVYDEH